MIVHEQRNKGFMQKRIVKNGDLSTPRTDEQVAATILGSSFSHQMLQNIKSKLVRAESIG